MAPQPLYRRHTPSCRETSQIFGALSTLMATATIDNSAWGGVKASVCKAGLNVRPYRLARPASLFLVAELILLGATILYTAWTRQGAGNVVLISACVVFFHVNNLDKSLVASTASNFWVDL